VLSFAFCFDREDERYHFALSQPYSLSRHELYVDKLRAKRLPHLRVEEMCKSIQGRSVHLLSVSSPANLAREAEQFGHVLVAKEKERVDNEQEESNDGKEEEGDDGNKDEPLVGEEEEEDNENDAGGAASMSSGIDEDDEELRRFVGGVEGGSDGDALDDEG